MDDPVLVKLDYLAQQIDRMAAKLDQLPDVYVPRREWDQHRATVDSAIAQIHRTLRDGPVGTRQTVGLIMSGVAVAASTFALLR